MYSLLSGVSENILENKDGFSEEAPGSSAVSLALLALVKSGSSIEIPGLSGFSELENQPDL